MIQHHMEECRKLFALRMSLLPYFYSSYVEYSLIGKPPIRALVLDYPEDDIARRVDDEYLFGESLLVCSLTYEEGESRRIYLPNGNWYDFFTGECVEGGRWLETEADYTRIPVYARDGAIIPLAKPVPFVAEDIVFEMEIRTFGDAEGSFMLYEDDFISFSGENMRRGIRLERHLGGAVQISRADGVSRYRF